MIDPMMELHNGTKRPVMFVVSTPYSGVPSETLIEPGGFLVMFDQRVRSTAMVRDLSEEEMDAYIEAKLEREKEDAERKVEGVR
jgi:hypothetical protein